MNNPSRMSRLLSTLPRKISAAAIVALAVFLPVASFAADTVAIEGAMGVSNVTAGDTQYKETVNAKYDQVVKYQVYYHNREDPNSNKIAQNLSVKINLPTTPGKIQKATTTIKADNSNTVTDSAVVNLDRADAYLQFIPGSATWKHNTGTNEAPKYVESKVSDAVVSSTNGVTLENAKPCYNFSATVTVLARVKTPGIQVQKQVRVDKEGTTYATTNTANAGDTLLYRIVYTNTGNANQSNVVLRDELPKGLTLVPGSAKLYNINNTNGTTVDINAVTKDGVDIGTYAGSSNAYIVFKAKVPAVSALACGENVYKNLGFASAKNLSEYYDATTTTVTKACQPTNPKTAVYSCDVLELTKKENRNVAIADFKTTATNSASFKNAVVNWGDGSTPLTTNELVGKTHTYDKDGTYSVVVTARFTVSGSEKTSTSEACTKAVVFTSSPVAPTTPEVKGENAALPDSGPEHVIGLFGIAVVFGTLGHRIILRRRTSSL